MKLLVGLFALSSAVMLGACSTANSVPLVFGSNTNLGFTAQAGAGEQGAALTLGYRTQRLAVVPVMAIGPNGQIYQLRVQGAGTQDAFSTFAHFQMTGDVQAGINSCLGDAFATGLAAQALAENLPIICDLSGGTAAPQVGGQT